VVSEQHDLVVGVANGHAVNVCNSSAKRKKALYHPKVAAAEYLVMPHDQCACCRGIACARGA
jgi:hypothetical protein